jgi:hypothetical protein
MTSHDGADRPAEPPASSGADRWRASLGQHRRRGAVRLEGLLAALVTAIVVVAAGGAVVNSELAPDQRFREFVNTGAMGEPVSARTFEVTVLSVRTAAEVGRAADAALDTDGVWVLVRVRAMADQESLWIGYAAVRDSRGRTWTATDRVDQPLVDSAYRLDPRIPVEADIVFEVPRDAATDLTIRVARPRLEHRMEAMAEIPLPVDEAMVASGLAQSEPVVIDAAEIVIADPQILRGGPETGR